MHRMPDAPKLYRDTDPKTRQSAEQMVAQITRRYPVDYLHDLRKDLPCLICDLDKFTGDAWRAQLIKPPSPVNELVVFPADFPKFARRKRSQIPDQRIRAGINDKTSEGEGIPHPDKTSGKQKPTVSPLVFPQPSANQRDAGFEHFLETVPSPTNKRVTAGGQVVPAEPGSVSPVTSKPTPFIPPHIAALEPSPVLVQSNPGMPPVLYQPIGSVAPLGGQTYAHPPPLEAMSMTTPPTGNVPVPAQAQSLQHTTEPSNPVDNNVANPLMNITNQQRVPYPEYEWERRLVLLQGYANRVYEEMERNSGVDEERYKLGNLEYEIVLEEINKLSTAIRDSQQKRSIALLEQSTRSRLSRVNGTDPESGLVRQNFEWWSDNNLMTDSGEFVSRAQSLRQGPITPAELNEIRQFLERTTPEYCGLSRTGIVVQQSPVRHHVNNAVPQNNVGGSPHRGAGSGRPSNRPHVFGLDGADSLPDEGESNQPGSEDLLTELQSAPEMTSTSSEYVKIPTKRETNALYGQPAVIDKYQKNYLQTEFENLPSAYKVKVTREGGDGLPSAKENTKTRADSNNTHIGFPFKAAPPSVSSDLSTNFTELSISSGSKTNTDHLLDPRYMRTIDSKGVVRTVLRTKAAEADLLKSKNKLQMKAMSPEYRDALKKDSVKKFKDPEAQKAFLSAMMQDPRFSSSNLTVERFSQVVNQELEKRQERARSLATIIEGVEPSVKTDIAETAQPKKDHDVSWGIKLPGEGCKTGILINLGDSDEDKPKPGCAGEGDKSREIGNQPKKGAKSKKKVQQLILDQPNEEESDKPDPDEVDAFFATLSREEEEEIAKYRAEHPL